MKTFTKIPSHYRRLNPDEYIRRGDLVKKSNGNIVRAYALVGCRSGLFKSQVFRRRHVETGHAKQLWGYISPTKTRAVKKQHPVEKNPLITFFYPRSGWRTDDKNCYKLRQVRLISANQKYFCGLEVSDKNRFKKFLRSRIPDSVQLLEFNPTAI